MEIEAELLGDFSVEEIKQGFMEDQEGYICLICGKRFEKGEIYMMRDRLFEGHKAVCVHIKQEHESVMRQLLNIKGQQMGISDLQLQLLNFFASGMTDKDIADKLGVSCSTIRNHRYKLRERERQSKLFLALMESLKEKGVMGSGQGDHLRGNQLYEASPISDKERKRILERYMSESGVLKSYPTVEKNKHIVLEAILEKFKIGNHYSEEQVNEILSTSYSDYKFLRDELIAYDYMARTNKGAIYWVKNYVAV